MENGVWIREWNRNFIISTEQFPVEHHYFLGIVLDSELQAMMLVISVSAPFVEDLGGCDHGAYT